MLPARSIRPRHRATACQVIFEPMIPSTPEILARLIAEPTVSRTSNLALLDYVEGLLRAVGARIERFSHPDGSRANLWATIGPDGPGGVVLSGHTDVVPVEGQDWSTDPFKLIARDGRFYGVARPT
jgi:acetylornithine deacetylase